MLQYLAVMCRHINHLVIKIFTLVEQHSVTTNINDACWLIQIDRWRGFAPCHCVSLSGEKGECKVKGYLRPLAAGPMMVISVNLSALPVPTYWTNHYEILNSHGPHKMNPNDFDEPLTRLIQASPRHSRQLPQCTAKSDGLTSLNLL